MPKLLQLPAEVILLILRLLCPHCIFQDLRVEECTCRADEELNLSPSTSTQSLQALSRLSQTCKNLRNLAQSVLYHSPMPCEEGYLALFHTLACSPDLALCVKELHLGTWDLSDENVSAKELILSTLSSTATLQKPGDREIRSRGAWFQEQPHGALFDKISDFLNNPMLVINALIVTLVPNVETIHLEIFDTQLPQFPFCRPGSLPHLTDLILQYSRDCEERSIDCVKNILDAAPSLERFKGIWINGMSSAVTHANLISIDLANSSLSGMHLSAIMRGFPKLETFGYEVRVSYEDGLYNRAATPWEVCNTLILRKDTLKDVDIHFASAYIPHSITRQTFSEAILGLAEMRVLEVLALDSKAICMSNNFRRDENSNRDGLDSNTEMEVDLTPGISEKDQDLLVDFLPPSIRYFMCSDPTDTLYQQLLQLAKRAPERFPNLKKVRIWGLDPDLQQKQLKAAFSKVGIKCFHGGALQ